MRLFAFEDGDVNDVDVDESRCGNKEAGDVDYNKVERVMVMMMHTW
jgi:hypothetical protein